MLPENNSIYKTPISTPPKNTKGMVHIYSKFQLETFLDPTGIFCSVSSQEPPEKQLT